MKIIFVCHGNICRSVMAEYIFKHYAKQENIEVDVCSRATSYEEIGNDIYYKAKYILDYYHISYGKHQAKRITEKEYSEADIVIVMDTNNYYNLKRIVSKMEKVHYLKEYSVGFGEIEDPWYTNNFDKVFNEIKDGVLGLIKSLKEGD